MLIRNYSYYIIYAFSSFPWAVDRNPSHTFVSRSACSEQPQHETTMSPGEVSIVNRRQSTIDNRESLRTKAIWGPCRLLLAATPTNTPGVLAGVRREGSRKKGERSFRFCCCFAGNSWHTLTFGIRHGANFEPIYLCVLNFAAINSTLSCIPAVCCLVSVPCNWTRFPCLLAGWGAAEQVSWDPMGRRLSSLVRAAR